MGQSAFNSAQLLGRVVGGRSGHSASSCCPLIWCISVQKFDSPGLRVPSSEIPIDTPSEKRVSKLPTFDVETFSTNNSASAVRIPELVRSVVPFRFFGRTGTWLAEFVEGMLLGL